MIETQAVRLLVRWTLALAAFAFPVGLLLLLMLAGGTSTPASAATCAADTDTSGTPTGLTDPDQQDNARTIIQTGARLQVPTKGLVVAIATAMQESGLRNLTYGDRDSVGLFQQRDAWGTFAERTDPATSAALFFTGGRGGQRGLLDIPGWQDMSVSVAAQAVQVSAFPTAYAKWETLAVDVVSAVTGGGQVSCDPGAATGTCKGGDLSGFPNGQLPVSALCALSFAPKHHLRADAAFAADQLDAAYQAQFGAALCVTDSYRTLAEQERLWVVKPGLAARPGTSNHGWGTAMDLCGGIQTFGDAHHQWMKAHAAAYKWHHPDWAEPGGSKPEPWHWEFQP